MAALHPFAKDDPKVGNGFFTLLSNRHISTRVAAGKALLAHRDSPEVLRALLPMMMSRHAAVRAVALAALHDVCLDHEDPYVRHELILVLRRARPSARADVVGVLTNDLGNEQTQNALISRGATDPDPTIRRSVAHWLANVADRPAVQTALMGLAVDPDDDVRFLAMEGLAPYASVPAIRATILHTLGDKCTYVRAAGAMALSTVAGDPLICYRLLSMLAPAMEPPDVRMAVALALRGHLNNRLVRRQLHQQMMLDPDEYVRQYTARIIEAPSVGTEREP